jgi:RAD51-like protein 1
MLSNVCLINNRKMAGRSIKRLGIEPDLCTILQGAGVNTATDLLEVSPLTLMVICNLSWEDSLKLIKTVAGKVAPSSMNVLEYYNERKTRMKHLPTGLSLLDTSLNGGLLLGTISDLCGPPGIGKTQFCMTCAVHNCASTLQASSGSRDPPSSILFIDTELKFDPSRLLEIAQENYEMFSTHNQNAPHNIDTLLEHIKVLFLFIFHFCELKLPILS